MSNGLIHGILTYLLQIAVHIPGQLPEQHTEQIREERSRQIQPLLSKVITVVQISSFKRGEEKTMNHVSEEVRLFRLGTLRHGDMRQHLFLEDLLSIS